MKKSNRFFFSPFMALLCAELVYGVFPVTVALLEGNAFISETHPDPFFGRFFIWPVSFILIFPAITYFLRMFHVKMKYALDMAHDDGILPNSKTMERALSIRKVITSPIKLIGIGIITVAYAVFFTTNIVKVPIMPTWPYGDIFGFSYLFWVVVFVWSLNIYILLNFVIDLIVWIRTGYILVSGYDDGEFAPMPYHPDNAAGLSLFGSVAITIYLIFVILIIFVCLNTYMSISLYPDYSVSKLASYSVGIISSFIAAAILLPFSFIMPMLPFRNLLSRIKNDKLHSIRRNIRKLHDKISDNNSSNEAIKESLERLSLMDSLYQKILKIPVWPFNGKTVKVYITSTLTPAFVFLLNLAMKLRGIG